MSRPVTLDRSESEAVLDLMDVWEPSPEHESVLSFLRRRIEDYLQALGEEKL